MRAGSEITVRRMESGDIAQVLEVERACFSEPWSAEVFSATLLLPYAYYYVAETRGEDGERKERSPMWRSFPIIADWA